MAVTPENIKRVDDYFTADSKSSICTISYDLGNKVVDPLDDYGSDCHASVFLGLVSSGRKALDDAVESGEGPQIVFLVAEGIL